MNDRLELRDDFLELDKFQATFLKVLQRLETAEDLKAALLAEPDCECLREWIESMSPKMLETAAQLIKKWGSTDPSQAV